MMAKWWEQMIGFQPSYGGLPVFRDNCYFPNQNGKIDNVVTDSNYFIAGPFDSGDSTNKFPHYLRYSGITTTMRPYDDFTETSVDYWAVGNGSGDRVVGTYGRYYLISIKKSVAADSYMYIVIDDVKHYLAKGNNVTD